MSAKKTKIVLIQLGSPKSPKVKDVRHFLSDFLKDPRVVDLNPFFWRIILYLFVLPFRPKRSAKLYSRIWDGKSFPLVSITEKFSKKVATYLAEENLKLAAFKDESTPERKLELEYVFLLSRPTLPEIWEKWIHEEKNGQGAIDEILFVPLFPQYAESTTASVIDSIYSTLKSKVNIPSFKVMNQFHRSKAFIDQSAFQIDQYLEKKKSEGIEVDILLMSFHGIPKRRVVEKKDRYFLHAMETFYLIRKKLRNVSHENVKITFQSRFGQEEWLTPYTEETVIHLISQGKKNIAVYSPSFVSDCLETLDELGVELKEKANEFGGEIYFIPCLNDNDQWCKDFAQLLSHEVLADNRTKISDYEDFHPIGDAQFYKELKMTSHEELKMKSPPLAPETKKSLKIIFLTIFLDLVGFSIIFPLFPQLAKHYLTVDSENFFLKSIFGIIEGFSHQTDGGGHIFSGIVLFGGILGALYSLLQFVAAPLWGGISDKIGRKPVLLISLFGLLISYFLWFFSGSFTLLIIARAIGGIMGGNISTATAVVADITSKENRSKGMAVIGIAFALGFIIGPAIGGILSTIDLTHYYPELASYGVNPFSMPAAFAFLLTLFNLWSVFSSFEESLPEEKRGKAGETERTANILKIFAPLPYPGVNLVNFGNFTFLTLFSGMEFTLTFLAFERLGFTSMNNAYMFIFIGLVLTLVQGGFVRRKAHQIGEKKLVLWGLYLVVPGLILIGMAQSIFLLYAGLFFLACGSSLIIPCLTTLVTLYTPSEKQGQSVGIFRSLGALGRVIGPIMASLAYAKFGSSSPYFFGSLCLIVPILLIRALPRSQSVSE